MSRNELGKIRQSAVIMNYGPGAIIDFRVPGSGAAASVVSAGLEQWEREAARVGTSSSDLKRVTEPRLAEKLGVKYFRLPPVAHNGGDDEDTSSALIGVRFPDWLQCPDCNLLRPSSKWGKELGGPACHCISCSSKLPGNKKRYVVPVRFVLACRHGHLSDFPWSEWAHHDQKCTQGNSDNFILESKGAGLAKLFVRCVKCNKSRSLSDIFRPASHKGTPCLGERPWLVEGAEECDQVPITVQRGASNLYFPQMESALLIPPWSEQVIQSLGDSWRYIEMAASREDRHKHIQMYWEHFPDEINRMGLVPFLEFVDLKIEEGDKVRSGNLRWDEYQQFMVARGRRQRLKDEFIVKEEPLPDTENYLGHLQRVVALREIRALKSFTRIEPPPGKPPVLKQFLSKVKFDWLPAVEVRGEGVFLALNMQTLNTWEEREDVQTQALKVESLEESRVLNPDGKQIVCSPALQARFLLLHSLAHILMKQLSLQCGYSSASLRERLYVGNDATDMAGVMIYTATSDSDGTLGGLQRQGNVGMFLPMFYEAIKSSEWCSSDPLCIKGLVSETEETLGAACHSCLLAPETSCEEYNRFLDRTMLVGTPENRDIGFFNQILR